MRKSAVLITGANGEMGRGLIDQLSKQGLSNLVALDLNPLDQSIAKLCIDQIVGSILDVEIIKQLNDQYDFVMIYHLAAMLSTQSETLPHKAHDINVNGTLNLLNMAVDQGKLQKLPIKFFFPSSIAVYGFNNLKEKMAAGAILENHYRDPMTMYGCNKLYCEHLGNYYNKNYQCIGKEKYPKIIDFRSIRFPGIISSQTIPTGGTSDYLPEMLHSAANKKSYKCFVRKNTQIPFMTMPDAIEGIIKLMQSPINSLSQTVYNISAFSPTVDEFREEISQYFPQFSLEYIINKDRQKMVDSWPTDLNDSAAQKDWGWNAMYNLKSGLRDYLIPNIKKKYSINGDNSVFNTK